MPCLSLGCYLESTCGCNDEGEAEQGHDGDRLLLLLQYYVLTKQYNGPRCFGFTQISLLLRDGNIVVAWRQSVGRSAARVVVCCGKKEQSAIVQTTS